MMDDIQHANRLNHNWRHEMNVYSIQTRPSLQGREVLHHVTTRAAPAPAPSPRPISLRLRTVARLFESMLSFLRIGSKWGPEMVYNIPAQRRRGGALTYYCPAERSCETNRCAISEVLLDALISRVTEGHAGLSEWPRARNTRTETATISLTERPYEQVSARCGWPTNQAHIV